MKTQRTILTIVLTIFSVFSFHLNPQGPGPVDMWDTLTPQEQLAPYIGAAKFAKGVFKGVGNEAKDIIDDPGQAAEMGVAGLGTAAFLQLATPEVAATTTRVLCTLATAETVAQLHSAYVAAPENQRSEAVGERLGRMITDVFFLRETIKASSSALTSFKPSKPLAYVVKVDDYAFAAKFNPDGHHLFSVGRNFGNDGFTFSVYGLDPINGLLYYGPQSVKSINSQVPVSFTQQTIDATSFYTKMQAETPGFMSANNPIEIIKGGGLATDAAQFVQTAKTQQINRITTLLNQVGIQDYTDPSVVFDKVSNKMDPTIYTPLENFLKISIENNIDALKECAMPVWQLLEFSGDSKHTSNIKGADGEIQVGVLQELMGRKLVDFEKKFNTKDIDGVKKNQVTFDLAARDNSNNLILIEVKNQKWGGGDEEKLIGQLRDQFFTSQSHPDLKGSKFEVWSEYPLTDVMKNFLNENNIKYFENYSSLVKLYFPEIKQPIFFDNPTPTHIQQFSLLNNFLSQAPSLKFTPPASWFTEQGYQAHEPPLRPTSSPFDSWSTGFAGMPLFHPIQDWTSGIKWDSYFDTIKIVPQSKSQPTDDPFHFKENGYYGAQFFRNSYPHFSGREDQIPFATDSNFDFSNHDGLKGGEYKGNGYTVGLGFGGGAAGIYGSYYISPVLASALLQIGVVTAGLYLIYWGLSPEYEYSSSILNNFNPKTPDQQKLAEAWLYTPNFPWKTFLEQEWDPQNLSLNNKPAKKQLKTHGNLYPRFQSKILRHVEPDNRVMTELFKVSTEEQEEYKKQHQKDELSDLYKLLYKTVGLKLQHALNSRMLHEGEIIRYNLILKHEEDAVVANLQTRIILREYQSLYLETAKAMVALQDYNILNELILDKTIALQRMLDFQHDFLKNYSQSLDSITKTDSSTYLVDRKNALDHTLAKPEEMTGTWRKSTVGNKTKDGRFVAYVCPEIITFGLPIQHALDNELFILRAKSEKSFYASTEAAQNHASTLFEGLIELIIDAHYMNSRGEMQQLISLIDNLRYLFDTIIESKLIGKNSPIDSKEKHNLCAINFAFNLMQELPALIQQADASFDTFKNTLKTALEEKISKTTDNTLVHNHFYKGIIKFINASSKNDGLKKLLETIQQSLLMAKKIDDLEGPGTGLSLLNFLIKNPDKFDEWVKTLNETQSDFNSKNKKQSEPKEFALIRQLLETKQCKACNLTAAHLNNQNLNDTTVDDADFTSAELLGISAEKMHANNTKFNKAHLDNAVFKSADCTNASFEDAYLKNTYFNACTLNNSQWHEAHLSGTVFHDITSSGLDLNSAHFTRSFFGITPMILHSKLTYSKASHTEFKDVIIQESSLNGLAADHAKFDKVVIVGTDFDNADLTDAIFDHCTIKNASFKGAKLVGSSWKDTTFENVNFAGANVHGVLFTQEQLKGAHGI